MWTKQLQCNIKIKRSKITKDKTHKSGTDIEDETRGFGHHV